MNNELKNETPEGAQAKHRCGAFGQGLALAFDPNGADSAGKPDSPEGACDCLDNFD